MGVIVRQVWHHNLMFELGLIRSLIPLFPYASMDTEFPGHIFTSKNWRSLSASQNYELLKKNVDALKIIQLGLALCDSQGNLPTFGSSNGFVWEFNFRDFDVTRDPHNPQSIELLKTQGIDFDKNRQMGISSFDFSRLILSSGLFCNRFCPLTWVTFHSSYDFGFLIKVLIQNRPLPSDVGTFTQLVYYFFGKKVYDMKYMMRFCNGLEGGLERVAKSLKVERIAGSSHQAGSDSLLTLQTFMKLKQVYFEDPSSCKVQISYNIRGFEGAIYGF